MRLRRTLIAVGVLILVIDGGILFARSRDDAAPVPAAAAVARFRGEARTPSASSTTTSAVATTTTSARPVGSPGRREVRPGPAAAAPSAGPRPAEPLLPSEGVYVYATTGRE